MALKDKIQIIPRKLIKDERGWFYKAITGMEDNIPDHTGEVYLTYGKPGFIRGGHYHPLAKEWFTIIEGKAILKLVEISVYVPSNIAHGFVSDGDSDFIVLAYSDRLYDPADTIKYDVL